MQIGNIIITVHPWNRQNTFWRLLLLGIILAWVIWGVLIFKEGREIDARLRAQQEIELNRQTMQLRRAAFERAQAEQRALQQEKAGNIMDMLPGGEQ